MFGNENEIGKSTLSDLQEEKKTLITWHAYTHSSKEDKVIIRKVLSKKKITRADLSTMRKIIRKSGALDYAKKEISSFLKKAQNIIKLSKIRPRYKDFLNTYSQNLLSL